METNVEKEGPKRGSLSSYAVMFRKVMRGDIREMSYDDKVDEVHEINRACALGAAALAAQPVPLFDLSLLLPIQVRLVQAIAKINGQPIDKGALLEIFDLYGLGIAAQYGLMTASKLVPVLGSLVAPPIAYALTLAIGEIADHYIRHGRGVIPRPLTASWLLDQNVKKTFRMIYKRRHEEFRQIAKREGDWVSMLEQLRVAYTRELMSEEEYGRLKNEILQTLTNRGRSGS